MTILWCRSDPCLTVGDRKFGCSCDVRTLANGRRRKDEIVRTMPGGKPFDPVRFPLGSWTVLRPRPRKDAYRAPFFIPTDAYAMVPVWTVEAGLYQSPGLGMDRDREYGMHYSTSKTTQGCIRIDTRSELLELVALITAALDAFEPVRLEVIE